MGGEIQILKHNFYLAPLRGITDTVFRSIYEKHFGQFDYTLAPFVPTVRGNRVRDYHIRDVLPIGNDGNDPKRLIPQIIGNDTDGFLLLCRRFADLGFLSVNWNLGCPAPLITKKKRGAGLLPHKDTVERFLDDVIPKIPIPLSIKTRLGLDSNDDLEKLIPIFNNYPLKELIIHPRTGSQVYEGTVDIDKFELCMKMSRHTVVYNGDIISVDDFKRLSTRFTNVNNWMIGRGIIKNPHLLKELKNEPATSTIHDFLDDLLSSCQNNSRPIKTLGRMKEIWRYLGYGLDESGALSERIIRCGSMEEYLEAVRATLARFSKRVTL
jgi:tRNA-dihydrouridine synthase